MKATQKRRPARTKPSRDEFLLASLQLLTTNAAFQRANIYRETVENPSAKQKKRLEEKKHLLRVDLRATVEQISKQYSRSVSEDVHVRNILSLSKSISKTHRKILLKGEFRVGIAQKALNLYLKYLWCLGRIRTPPHCPVDAVIQQVALESIGKTSAPEMVKWTKMRTVAQYNDVICTLKKAAKDESLAEWELASYGLGRDR